MSTADGFGLQPPKLLAHAAHVAAVGDAVATARDAGRQVRLEGNAYGMICAAVPIMLGALQDALIDAEGVAADSLHVTADRLRAVAARYDALDSGGAAKIRGASGRW